MRASFKYRLFTNVNQERELAAMLETHRRLYNSCLAERQDRYRAEKRTVTYTEQSARFKAERSVNHYYARLNFSSAQATMRRLDKTFAAFFRRLKAKEEVGYPRFKARGQFRSIEFPAIGNGIHLNDNRLRVQYVGTIRVKLHRPVEGKIKTVRLKQEAGRWYVIFSCELPDVPVVDNGKPALGVDVGLESFLTTSDGEQEPNPRYLKEALPSLRRAYRSVSRKKLHGSNRRKAVRRLVKIFARVRNLRREHHHKVALRLVRRVGLIAVENLDIKGMLRSGRLARAISDAGWYSFILTLRYKAAKAGIAFVEVDPKGTSQGCSGCGEVVAKSLRVRQHKCPHCGLSLHRDHNAALNILARGLARTEPVGIKAGPS